MNVLQDLQGGFSARVVCFSATLAFLQITFLLNLWNDLSLLICLIYREDGNQSIPP